VLGDCVVANMTRAGDQGGAIAHVHQRLERPPHGRRGAARCPIIVDIVMICLRGQQRDAVDQIDPRRQVRQDGLLGAAQHQRSHAPGQLLPAAAILLLVVLGLNPWSRIPLLYALAVGTVLLNQLRQLADHHFEGDGSRVDVEAHILDSCNFTGRDPLTLLFFPFSIRYHALHHLFPSMPYHHLKQAHEHLTATLPAESPYLSLDQAGWWSVARRTLGGTPQPARGA
jgi:hypothetical protein